MPGGAESASRQSPVEIPRRPSPGGRASRLFAKRRRQHAPGAIARARGQRILDGSGLMKRADRGVAAMACRAFGRLRRRRDTPPSQAPSPILRHNSTARRQGQPVEVIRRRSGPASCRRRSTQRRAVSGRSGGSFRSQRIAESGPVRVCAAERRRGGRARPASRRSTLRLFLTGGRDRGATAGPIRTMKPRGVRGRARYGPSRASGGRMCGNRGPVSLRPAASGASGSGTGPVIVRTKHPDGSHAVWPMTRSRSPA